MVRPGKSREHARRGTAIVAALALVMLGAALLASAAAVSSSGAHAEMSERASLAAETGAQRALARAVMSWDAASDALAVGSAREQLLAQSQSEWSADLPIAGRLRILRLAPTLFAVTVDIHVGGFSPIAHRRVRLLVQRSVVPNIVTAPGPPTPIARWSTSDLY